MSFTTPAFVRVENPAERQELIEWLKIIGYTTTEYRKRDFYVIATSVTITGEPMCPYARTYPKNAAMPSLYTDCGESVPLFKALAAMNDSNDREQWFIDRVGGDDEYDPKGDYGWYLCKDAKLRCAVDCYSKATAEEIIEHFSDNK